MKSLVNPLLCITLMACGGGGEKSIPVSSGDTAQVNSGPSAKIEAHKQSVEIGASVVLDGSESVSPENSQLSYQWEIKGPDGDAIALEIPRDSSTQFYPQLVGEYTISLTVKDSNGVENSAQTTIQTVNPTSYQLAVSASKSVKQGAVVDYQAMFTHTDLNDNSAQYSWQLLAKPESSQAQISDSQEVSGTFIADKTGEYQLQLTTQLGDYLSRKLVKTITAYPPGNVPPVTNINTYHLSQLWPNDTLMLTSYGNDADNDPLSFKWSVTGGEYVEHDANNWNYQFQPEQKGEYTVCLEVSDGALKDKDCVTLNVIDTNRAPTAAFNISDPTQLSTSDPITLVADAKDLDGDQLTYQWQVISKPKDSSAVLDDSATERPVLKVDREGTYEVQLTVSDGINDSMPFSKLIQVSEKPTFSLSIQDVVQNITINKQSYLSATINGTYKDLTFEWSVLNHPEGATAEFSDSSSTNTYFQVDMQGDYLVQLQATNTSSQSVITTLNLVADNNPPPVALISGQQKRSIQLGEPTLLDGDLSFDPEQQAMSFHWQVFDTNSEELVMEKNTPSFEFSPTKQGVYRAVLKVDDGQKYSESQALINVLDTLPQTLITKGKLIDVAGKPVAGVYVSMAGLYIPQESYSDARGYTNKLGEFSFSFNKEVLNDPANKDWQPKLITGNVWRGGRQEIALSNYSGNTVDFGTQTISVIQDAKLEITLCDNFYKDEIRVWLRASKTDSTDAELKAATPMFVNKEGTIINTRLSAPAHLSVAHGFTLNGEPSIINEYEHNDTNNIIRLEVCRTQ